MCVCGREEGSMWGIGGGGKRIIQSSKKAVSLPLPPLSRIPHSHPPPLLPSFPKEKERGQRVSGTCIFVDHRPVISPYPISSVGPRNDKVIGSGTWREYTAEPHDPWYAKSLFGIRMPLFLSPCMVYTPNKAAPHRPFL